MVVVPTASASSVTTDDMAAQLATLVIDRQPLFLAALGSLLAAPPLSARVTSTSSSEAGLDLVRAGGVDLVFCELRAEPIGGVEFVRHLGEEQLTTPVILLGDREDGASLVGAISSPAAGLFTKDAGVQEFLGGVGAVISGHRAIGAGLMNQILDRLSQQRTAPAPGSRNQLSTTELEILTMIGRAQSVNSIAASRGISNKTVRNHLGRIYRKLELHGRTEAVLWAARMGL
jgi:DNA-binding NarL/FixJ family response regulator